MLRENGNKEAEFDVSKLTVFCVDVFSNEDNITQKLPRLCPRYRSLFLNIYIAILMQAAKKLQLI